MGLFGSDRKDEEQIYRLQREPEIPRTQEKKLVSTPMDGRVLSAKESESPSCSAKADPRYTELVRKIGFPQ